MLVTRSLLRSVCLYTQAALQSRSRARALSLSLSSPLPPPPPSLFLSLYLCISLSLYLYPSISLSSALSRAVYPYPGSASKPRRTRGVICSSWRSRRSSKYPGTSSGWQQDTNKKKKRWSRAWENEKNVSQCPSTISQPSPFSIGHHTHTHTHTHTHLRPHTWILRNKCPSAIGLRPGPFSLVQLPPRAQAYRR